MCASIYLISKRSEIALWSFYLNKNDGLFFITLSKITDMNFMRKKICIITKNTSKSWAWVLETLYWILFRACILIKKILHTWHSNTLKFSGDYRVFTPYILPEISYGVRLHTCSTRNFFFSGSKPWRECVLSWKQIKPSGSMFSWLPQWCAWASSHAQPIWISPRSVDGSIGLPVKKI